MKSRTSITEFVRLFPFAFIVLLIQAGEYLMQQCTYTSQCVPIVHDCQDIQDLGYNKSGRYRITPVGTHDGYDVYCDMNTNYGGWLVFQRRMDGSENFCRTWNDYEIGFGNVGGEHWLGNIPLHLVTSQSQYQLRVDLYDWENNTAYATYKRFEIGDFRDHYTLYVGGYSGTAGDSLKYHNGRQFATKDYDRHDCAKNFSGGWWFDDCLRSNLNGKYIFDGVQAKNVSNNYQGVQWLAWTGDRYYSLKNTEMKIKRL